MSDEIKIKIEDICIYSKRVDGNDHGWIFDGDDPYVKCEWCGQVRDAITDRIIIK